MIKQVLVTVFFLAAIGASAQLPCEGGFAGEWPCANVDVQAYMTLDDIGGAANTNDIWGWTDAESGREFALVGKSNGTAFVEITVPNVPVYLGTLPTQSTNSLWRDVKVYADHAFIVSEADDHGMQVFDLTQLLDVAAPPVTFANTALYDGFGDAHNICINEDTGFAYAVGTDNFSGGLDIVDISDPANPVIAGGFSGDGYTHDAQIVVYMGPDTDYAGKELAFACNEDNVAIIDCTDKTDCELISHMEYDGPEYTHQGWLTEDHKFFLVNDELDEMNTGINTRTYIFDVQDIDEPFLVGYYESNNTAIDHNLYVIGDLVYQSNYRSGLRILDCGDVENNNMFEVGFFDVSPSNDNPSFSGTWSNYAWYPSGNVVVTDMNDGFFVLRPVFFKTNPEVAEIGCSVDETTYSISTEIEFDGMLSVAVEGLAGVVSSADDFEAPGNTTVTLTGLSSLENGEYDFNFVVNTGTSEYKVKGNLVKEGTLAAIPTMTTPADISVVGTEVIDFAWDEDPDAMSYNLQVATDIMFTDLVVDEEVMTNSYAWDDSAANATYFWRVSATNDCGETEYGGPFSFQLLVTDVATIEADIFAVYPNPASGEFQIKSNEGLGEITIQDLSGRTVYQSESVNLIETIDVSALSEGIYTISCDAGTTRLSITK